MKRRLRIDDTLDVFAVHGVGGITGSILVAILAAPALGGVGYAAGIGMGRQLVVQIVTVAGVAAWSLVATFVLVKLIGAVTGLRVSREQEIEGLDVATHGERAYDLM